MSTENELSSIVIGIAMKLHKSFGPGLLESVYVECMAYELEYSGWFVEKQKPIPLIYNEVAMECGYRIDLLVENKLVIEVKSVDVLHPVHKAQLLTYLKLGNYKLGLLINFNSSLLKDGIQRVVNNL